MQPPDLESQANSVAEAMNAIRLMALHDPVVVVMRGAPGSGKSTIANKLVESLRSEFGTDIGSLLFSADAERMVDGKYCFDAINPDRAHGACFSKFMKAAQHLRNGFIVIDNTNVQAWEISPYVAVARSFGWSPVVLTVLTPLEVCLRRQTHGVPKSTLSRMEENIRRTSLPPMWKHIVARGEV
jgi:NEDD4-binding protein 2